jgi:hypothetical protein
MLGGMSCAYAQEGPSEKMRGGGDPGPSMQDRNSSDTANNPSAQSDEKPNRSERGESTKARSAEKSDAGKPEDKSSKARSAEDKSDTKRATKTDEPSSRQSRTDEDKSAPDKSAKGNDGDTTNKSATDTRDQSDRKAAESESKEGQKTAGDKTSLDKAKHVDLTGDKKTRVQAAFKGAGDVKHRTNVDIRINVGTRLPRDWEFVPVPVAVVEIVPEYRDYLFVWVDDQYVICDPNTYEVVAVLPADRTYAAGSTNTGGGSKCAQLSLSKNEEELILESVRGGKEVDISDLSVGRTVPRDVELLTFPDRVISEASELRSCRYFDAGDQLAIVDPDEDKIVAIIDKG